MTKIWIIITLSLLVSAFSAGRSAYRAIQRLPQHPDDD